MIEDVDHKQLIEAEMDENVVDDLLDGAAQYGAIAVSRRASIEHCELIGAAKAVQAVAEHKTEDAQLLVVCIDSQSVLRWIGGVNECRDVEVHRKVGLVYQWINALSRVTLRCT